MYIDEWGHGFKTEEECIKHIIECHMDIENLCGELSYWLSFETLFAWIHEKHWEDFKKDFAKDIQDASRSYTQFLYSYDEEWVEE